MKIEQTLSIIKPDAVAQQLVGEIYQRFVKAGFRIIAARMLHLTAAQAKAFYRVHQDRNFFDDLVTFMVSGPIMVQVLQGEDVIAKHRDLMGATDPKVALPGTIRADLAQSIEANAVHGSDTVALAQEEITFFFTDDEIFG